MANFSERGEVGGERETKNEAEGEAERTGKQGHVCLFKVQGQTS